MAVHFKFRSAVAFDSIPVEGTGITIANLKDKIGEQKNLGRSTNFDLVITNAESGEEYTEDTFLVPKNTSVIIKRVPARRAKTTLLVNEPEDDVSEQRPARSVNKDIDMVQLALTSPIDELYDMDDFGVDLYAVDESALTHVEADETSNASAFLAKNAMEERRSTQEISPIVHGKDALVKGFARGASYRAVPHVGYVCHRCGFPGHFIQHCPTNGDPSYDLKVSRLRAEWNDLSTFVAVGGQPDDFIVKEVDLPAELRCSLCQGIFKEAVMIPCCQYSFCDTCARQYLLEKGSCPQCGSDRLKDSDLLPNVALRQAIDRFMTAQTDTAVPNEGADGESATKAAKSLLSPAQLQKMSSTVKDLTTVVVVDNQPEVPVVDDSVCESAIGSKEKAVNEGSKLGALVGEASSVGKKKKKPLARPPSISEMVSEHMAGKSRKVNKLCYVCGSPDHIARNCTANAGDSTCFPSQRGVFRPLPPRTINPFGQEMYWPGPVPYSAPALPVGPYGPVPYGTPALPVGPYGVSSFTPPLYPNPQMHGFLNGAPHRMVGPRERPLSREEFMELQERERRRRLTQDRRERELSDERLFSVSGSEDSMSSGSEHGLNKQWPPASKSQGMSRRHDLDSNFSRELGNTRSKQKKQSRKAATERVDEHLALQQCNRESDEDSAYNDPRGLMSYAHRFPQGVKHVLSMVKKASRVYDRSPDSNYEEGQHARKWGLRDETRSKLSMQIALGRGDCSIPEKREHTSYVKHDGTRVSEAGAAEMLRSSRHRSKMAVLEGARFLYSDQSIQFAAEAKERHNHHAVLTDDGDSIEVVKQANTRKRHNHAKSVITDDASGDIMKKKRKHKKHKAEGSKDASMRDMLMVVSHKKSSKRHKSCHTSSALVDKTSAEITPVLDDMEESRWLMDDGLEDGLGDGLGNDSISHRERSKYKHYRSSKSALYLE